MRVPVHHVTSTQADYSGAGEEIARTASSPPDSRTSPQYRSERMLVATHPILVVVGVSAGVSFAERILEITCWFLGQQ